MLTRNKRLIIFGNTNFSMRIKRYIESEYPNRCCCFCVNKKYISKNEFDGIPVVPFEDIESLFPPNQYDMLIALGYNKMNDIYKSIFFQAKEKGYYIPNYVHKNVEFYGEFEGEGNIILSQCYVGIGTRFGNGNRLLQGNILTHDTVFGDFNYCAAGIAFAGNVTIKNNCFIGMNATLKNSITIDDHTLVGAGAYISKNTEPNSVYVPVKSVKLDKSSNCFF